MKPILLVLTLFLFACNIPKEETPTTPYVMVLGVAQDAGYPQMNCIKECCKMAWENAELQKMTASLAIIDPTTKQQWIIDATPNIKDQIQLLKIKTGTEKIDGVFLTHAHIGHYTGLMYFGREVMGTNKIPVFAMPKMKSFIEENGPWSQLVALENISLQKLTKDATFGQESSHKCNFFLIN
jgi:pyrroloquinoline quinone biosynthesis protein B